MSESRTLEQAVGAVVDRVTTLSEAGKAEDAKALLEEGKRRGPPLADTHSSCTTLGQCF